MAAYTNNVKVVEVLLKRGARINPVHPQGDFGYPLQAAVKNGHVSMTKLLLESGADVNAVGGKFATALQAAAEQGSDKLVNILLDSGAEATTGRLSKLQADLARPVTSNCSLTEVL